MAATRRTSVFERRGPADALELARPGSPAGASPAARAAARRSRRGRGCCRRRSRSGPCAGRSAPVKAPFSWPKSSLSTSDGRQRRAVDADERPGPARAQAVDGVGDQLLADAGLALEEDRARRGRHLLDPGEHVPQTSLRPMIPRSPPRLDLLPQVGVVGLEPLAQPLDLGKAVRSSCFRRFFSVTSRFEPRTPRKRHPPRSPASRRGRSSVPARPRSGCEARGGALPPPPEPRRRARPTRSVLLTTISLSSDGRLWNSAAA